MCDVRRTGGGRGLFGGGQVKEWMGCFLDDLTQSFQHQRRLVNVYSPGRAGGMAQNGRTRGGIFRGGMDCCRESQGWTTACSGISERDGKDKGVCPNVTGRTEKERLVQSKRARAGSLALVDKPQVARTCILRTFGLQIDAMTSFSGVTFVLFFASFSSLFFTRYAFVEAATLRSMILR